MVVVQGVGYQFFKEQGGDWFSGGLQRLIERWDKCVDIVGDYVENLGKYESDIIVNADGTMTKFPLLFDCFITFSLQ